MPAYGLVITLSDVELTAEQSERLLPALDSAFGSHSTSEVSTSGPYHLWRVTDVIQAASMLEAAETVIRMAREVRAAAGIDPAQAVGFSSQLRDLTHPIESVL